MFNKEVLESHSLAGYYIISQKERQECMNDKVIPNMVLSASRCICDIYPDIDIIWNDSKKNKEHYRKLLGLNIEEYKEMEIWVNESYECGRFGYPDVFNTLETAMEFCNKFLGSVTNLKIVGIALPHRYIDDFLEEQDDYEHGVYSNIKKSLIVNPNGKVLGYEILGYEYGGFHSYMCNGLEDDYLEKFDFKLNENGFISDLEEADIISEYTNEEIEGTEPVLWLPWSIIEYSLDKSK